MIIIGDVHGSYKTLLALLEKLPDDEICFVGDLIDRGPSSKEVIELVRSKGYKCVKGNHEDMMLSAFRSGRPTMDTNWMRNGGMETLSSYNSPEDDELLLDHLNWMNDLPIYLEFPSIANQKGRHLVVSHSSVAKVWTGEYTKFMDVPILWNRDICHGTLKTGNIVKNIYNVFGHSIFKEPVITKGYADIDTGGCFDKGKLTALQFPEMKIFQQSNIS